MIGLAKFLKLFEIVGGVLKAVGPVAHRLTAYNSTASISVPTSPTVALTNHDTASDTAFSAADGVITFDRDCAWSSTVSVLATCATGTPVYYTDAETSVDGGETWVRGSNSMRCEQLAAGYVRTREFSFAGRFTKGTKLRFVEWASAVGVTLQTVTNNGSTAPARRITYLRVPAIVL